MKYRVRQGFRPLRKRLGIWAMQFARYTQPSRAGQPEDVGPPRMGSAVLYQVPSWSRCAEIPHSQFRSRIQILKGVNALVLYIRFDGKNGALQTQGVSR